MPVLARGTCDLYYERHGREGAPPVVLLHGLGSSFRDWAGQLPAFAARYRVLGVDLRGHGRSRTARWRLSVPAMAADVAALLDHLAEPPAHLVGLSLGGCVALALALDAPDRVRSLTLVNAFARLRPAGWAGARRMLARLGLALVAPMPVVAAHVARALFPEPPQQALREAAIASLRGTGRRAYLAAIAATTLFDVRHRLGDVRCPTLVVAGALDRTVPRSAQEQLAVGIADARLLVVPGSGHATPHDQPERFRGAVLDFLAAH
jgi:pimeloyl-ACP methyl ester carboxylesterase